MNTWVAQWKNSGIDVWKHAVCYFLLKHDKRFGMVKKSMGNFNLYSVWEKYVYINLYSGWKLPAWILVVIKCRWKFWKLWTGENIWNSMIKSTKQYRQTGEAVDWIYVFIWDKPLFFIKTGMERKGKGMLRSFSKSLYMRQSP